MSSVIGGSKMPNLPSVCRNQSCLRFGSYHAYESMLEDLKAETLMLCSPGEKEITSDIPYSTALKESVGA